MSVVIWVCTITLAVAALLAIARLATARDGASRAVVGDLVYFSVVGVLVMLGLLTGVDVVVDLAMLAALLGILATIALSRILTRGRR